MEKKEFQLIGSLVILGVVIFVVAFAVGTWRSHQRTFAFYDPSMLIVYSGDSFEVEGATFSKPVVNIRDRNIAGLNEYIAGIFGEARMRNNFFRYQFNQRDGILSLLIETGDPNTILLSEGQYTSFNIDLETNMVLTTETLSNRLGITLAQYEAEIVRQLSEHYRIYYRNATLREATPVSRDEFMVTALTNPINFETIVLYLCPEAKVCFFYEPLFPGNAFEHLSRTTRYSSFRISR